MINGLEPASSTDPSRPSNDIGPSKHEFKSLVANDESGKSIVSIAF